MGKLLKKTGKLLIFFLEFLKKMGKLLFFLEKLLKS